MKAPSLLTWRVCHPAFALKIPLQVSVPPAENPACRSQTIWAGAFRARQVDRVSRAVQGPTTVGDYATDPYDKAFEPFVEFQTLLKKLFPLVHAHAKVEHINRLGLLYTFQGVDTTRKPILFTAHQDVVPIDDPSDWAHPPFEGHFDGEWLWGRGASDCKNSLIGVLSALEDLGKEKKKFLLDEGGMGLSSLGGDSDSAEEILYALPAVGKRGKKTWSSKGKTDCPQLAVPGRTQLYPPSRGIGIIAEILYELERQELFTAKLDSSHPTYGKLECQRISPMAVSRPMPYREKISAIVNYRVALHQTPDLVWARFAGVTRSVFESHPDPTKRQSSLAHGTESEEVVESVPRVVVTGDVMTGNTDTRFYWSLTENIYRWSPSREGTALNIHTVDERVQLDAHLEGIMLYYDLVRAFDGWDEKLE
ncbi:Peptidase M20 [Penicillium chermesinum]|uniref:Peptidase M20 n=1 Tax=Penicillium chermesinum TaxID=63820 RepID=A0A9W9NK46_9EURO|nr:Peptidase M20 [Penicillium chermesinum]KAJ5220118.1 Peptidase M20 [Penicillium chermesinum]